MSQPGLTRKRVDRRMVALAAIVATVLAVMGVTVFVSTRSQAIEIQRDDAEQAGTTETDDSVVVEEPSTVVVHIDGAVSNPGVYTLTSLAPRVCDAVEAAGGLTDGADTTTVNLASLITDGSKIHIPMEGESVASTDTSATSTASDSSSSSSGLVNINTATLSELCTLSGVGEATAQAIIDDREANGPFDSIEDITRVSGIGDKKFAKIKDYICV